MQSPRRSSLPAGGGYSYDDDDVDVDALAPPPSLIEDLRNIFAMLNDEEFESEVQIERSRRDAEKKPAASVSIKKSAAAGPATKKKTSPRHALPLARAEMTTTPQNINKTATTAAAAASILPMDEDQPLVAEQSPATAAVFPPSAKKKQTKQQQPQQQKSVEDESWNTSFIPLQQFKQKNGHVTLPHPAEDATHANLYSWIAVATQICQGRLASNGGGNSSSSSSSSATTSSSSALTAEQMQQLHDSGLPVPAPSPAAAPVTAKVDKARAKRAQAAAAATAHVATTSRRSLRERTATKSKEYGDHAGAHAASATKAASKSAAAVVAKVKNPMPKPSSKATPQKKKQRVAAPVTMAATVATTTKQRLNQEQMWDLSCEKLRKFKKVAGHVDVPPQHSLFKWLLRQRLQWRYALQGLRSTMTENRIQRLSQLGVVPAQPPTVAQVVVAAAAQLLDPTNTNGKRTAPDHDDDDCIGGPTSNKKHKNDHTDTNKSMNQHNLMPATAGAGAHPPPHFPLQPTLTFPLGPLPTRT